MIADARESFNGLLDDQNGRAYIDDDWFLVLIFYASLCCGSNVTRDSVPGVAGFNSVSLLGFVRRQMGVIF